MFKLAIIQALHGDCLILEYGSQDDPHYLLIDGGPSRVYKGYMKEELQGIRNTGGKIDLAVLSHVDDDHVKGLLDLLHELIKQRKKGQEETITIAGLWHNSFGQTLGATVERGLARHMEAGWLPRGSTPWMDKQARSISQGHELTACARGLGIPINAEFKHTPDRVVCLDNLDKPIQLANLSIQIVGPSRNSLQSLQVEWDEWLAKQEQIAAMPASEAKAAARELDKSVPNLSSIMLLVEAEGKTVLLTGDGRGDHILEGMELSGVLKKDGTYHVNVFKLAHHGSARNVTAELFERITADTYVICANGKYDNPDYQTLEWLVQAASKQGRSFDLIATSDSPSIKVLTDHYEPAKYHYNLAFIEQGAHKIILDLSAPTLQAA